MCYRRYSDAIVNAIEDASPVNVIPELEREIKVANHGIPELEREIDYAETKLDPLMHMKYSDQLNLKERHACTFMNAFR